MLNIEQCLEELTLESKEYAHLAEDTYYNSSKFKVYVPKVMPGIPFGQARQWVEAVNVSLYSNAPDCKIASGSTIKCQNFLSVSKLHSSNFSHKSNINNDIKTGEKFIASIMNGNIKDMRLEEIL